LAVVTIDDDWQAGHDVGVAAAPDDVDGIEVEPFMALRTVLW
jgi:hypothetical protein